MDWHVARLTRQVQPGWRTEVNRGRSVESHSTVIETKPIWQPGTSPVEARLWAVSEHSAGFVRTFEVKTRQCSQICGSESVHFSRLGGTRAFDEVAVLGSRGGATTSILAVIAGRTLRCSELTAHLARMPAPDSERKQQLARSVLWTSLCSGLGLEVSLQAVRTILAIAGSVT
jgi:hypothetical protein